MKCNGCRTHGLRLREKTEIMRETTINVGYFIGVSFTFHGTCSNVRISCSTAVFPSELRILYVVIFKRVWVFYH